MFINISSVPDVVLGARCWKGREIIKIISTQCGRSKERYAKGNQRSEQRAPTPPEETM